MRRARSVVVSSFACARRGPHAERVAAARRSALVFLLIIAASICPALRLLAAPRQASAAQNSSSETTLRPAAATAADLPFTESDSQAQQLLLQFANQARWKAGVPALRLDPALCRAAQAHALNMLAAHELSHQLEGELSLPQRLAAATQIQFDREGENVALDYDAEDGHNHLMMSPPHRANLLNPAYNVVGIGVVQAGDRLYIVQDFAHALPAYSAAEFKDHVAAAVSMARHQAKQPDLARQDFPEADDAACSMAQAGNLLTAPIHQLAQRYTILTYNQLKPETLPASAGRILSAHNLRTLSIGSCFSRTDTYPAGAYWVVLALR